MMWKFWGKDSKKQGAGEKGMPKKSDQKLAEGVFKIESPEELLREYESTVSMIKDLIALENKTWEEKVLPTIHNFAGLVQKLPASKNNHHSFSKGLLAHSLECARLALRLFKNENFIAGYPTETRKFMEEKWGLAILYAALLHDVAKVITDIEIKSPDGRHKWNGVAESIYDWAKRNKIKGYVFSYNEDRKYSDHEIVNNVVTSRIVTPESISFLTEHDSEILTALLYSLTGQNATGRKKIDKIQSIVKKSDQLSVEKDKKTYKTPSEKNTQVIAPIDRLIDLICRLIINHDKAYGDHSWGLNMPGGGLFINKAKKGALWIAWENKKIERLKAYASKEPGCEDIGRLPEAVIEGMLVEAGLFYERQERREWSCSLQLDDWVTRLNLRVIAHEDILNAAAQKLFKDKKETPDIKPKDDFADLMNMPYSIHEILERNNPELKYKDEEEDAVEEFEEVEEVKEVEEVIEASEMTEEAEHEAGTETENNNKKGVEGNEEEIDSSRLTKSDKKGRASPVKPATGNSGETGIKKTGRPCMPSIPGGKAEAPKETKAGVNKKTRPSAPQVLTRSDKDDRRDKLAGPKVNTEYAVKKGKSEGEAKKTAKESLNKKDKDKVVKRINPAECPDFKRLQGLGEAGPILCTIGVNILLQELAEKDVFKTENGYIALSWPRALEEQGRKPVSLRETLILESAIIPSDDEGRSYLHEKKSPKNKLVSCLVLSPVHAGIFEKAFLLEPSSLNEQKTKKTSTKKNDSPQKTEKNAEDKPNNLNQVNTEGRRGAIEEILPELDEMVSIIVADMIDKKGWLKEPAKIYRNKNAINFIKKNSALELLRIGISRVSKDDIKVEDLKPYLRITGDWASLNPAHFKTTNKLIGKKVKLARRQL